MRELRFDFSDRYRKPITSKGWTPERNNMVNVDAAYSKASSSIGSIVLTTNLSNHKINVYITELPAMGMPNRSRSIESLQSSFILSISLMNLLTPMKNCIK